MQDCLFKLPTEHCEHLPLTVAGQTIAELIHYPHVFADCGHHWLSQLLQETPWQQDKIHIAGKEMDIPRLQCWYGDPTAYYQYSGIPLRPQPWTNLLSSIKLHVERISGYKFNSALVNYYRNGEDSVSWHADDEAELGEDPVIASVSLGQTRSFSLKRQKNRKIFLAGMLKEKGNGNASFQRLNLPLKHGSLLIMGAGMQSHYVHSVPKDKNIQTERINITFRKILLPLK